jgi:hypothetical protein
MPNHSHADHSDVDAMVIAVEDVYPQVPFAFLDLSAQRRLSYATALGSFMKIALFGNGDDVSEVPKG